MTSNISFNPTNTNQPAIKIPKINPTDYEITEHLYHVIENYKITSDDILFVEQRGSKLYHSTATIVDGVIVNVH